MVERPIKKSERQASDTAEKESNAQPNASDTPVKSEVPAPRKGRNEESFRGKDRGKGKGKGKRGEEEPARAVSPALMRGPRPTRPKPPVVKAEPEPSDAELLDGEGNEGNESPDAETNSDQE